MSPKTLQETVSPMAFLNRACEYADAANELFRVADARPKIQGRYLQLSSPLYFLYGHAAELALKAFLRAKNISTWGHSWADLYTRCHALGLVTNPSNGFEIGSIVSLLENWNKDQGFRYFVSSSGPMPELPLVRDVITELIRAVEPHVPADGPQRLAKVVITIGKPPAR